MAIGSVKFFNSQRGFGFIKQEKGPDVFCHFSGIVGDGYRNLNENDRVEFDIAPGKKGPQAVNIRVIG